LNGICQSLASLRIADQNGSRVDLELRRFELDTTRTEQDVLDFVLKWLEYPKIRECLADPKADWREVAPRLRALFGLDPVPSKPPASESP
jgi:hypothetical protein